VSNQLLRMIDANLNRSSEGLRVLEDVARFLLNDAGLSQRLRTLRHDLAQGTKSLSKGLLSIEGGARVIQLRDKQSKKGELLLVAQKLKDLCSQAGVLFIINDYLDLAVAVDADGLHVGQGDLPLPVIRRELPVDKIVGCSVTTLSQAKKAQAERADYIAVGSIFPTATKKEATVVGIDILKEFKRTVFTPLVAIGGINQNNIGEVVSAGADTVAVISAVLSEKDVKEAVQKLIAKMDLAKEECQNQ